MSTRVMLNGELLPPGAAKISVFDRGFLFGDSVFETIRTYGGRPFRLSEHLARLARSAERVFIELPVALPTFVAEIDACLRDAANEESYIRVMVTRGSGPLGLDSEFEAHPARVIIVAPLSPPGPETYQRGIKTVSFRTQRNVEGTDAAGAKVGNYLVAVLAMRQARAQGAAEALIVDASGCVTEGASSNVFAFIDGCWITPPEDVGILPGITRRTILDLLVDAGAPLRLSALPLDELTRAEEVFVCSSIREILPVVAVDDVRIGSGTPGARTRELLQLFHEKVSEIMGLTA
ncbi:MAG: aminotransferase class IV [Polyangiaceae bacterium]